MTKQALLRQIRATTRLCRGPLPSGARALVTQLIQVEEFAKASLIDMANRNRTEQEPYVVGVEETGNPRNAVIAHLSNKRTEPLMLRSICGYDFNEIISKGPFDGQEHEYTCPQCGVTGWYQAPNLKDPEEMEE